LLSFAAARREDFYFSELVDELRQEPEILGELMQENLLFTDLLRLYEIGSVNVAAWQAAPDEVVSNAAGELDVGYCLHRLSFEEPLLFGIAELTFSRGRGAEVYRELEYCRQVRRYRQPVTFTDFLIEV